MRDQFWMTDCADTSMDALAAATGLGRGSLYGVLDQQTRARPPRLRRSLRSDDRLDEVVSARSLTIFEIVQATLTATVKARQRDGDVDPTADAQQFAAF